MPVFKFSGQDASGSKVHGERVAENKQVLAAQLRKERIVASAIKEKGKEFNLPKVGSSKVPVKDIAIFFRQFSVMIDAGLPLVQCLEILAANQENPTFQKSLTGVRTTVEGGATLANAMRGYPKVFDDLTTNMIEAGETGGILDLILQRLATYVEKAVKLKAQIKSAITHRTSRKAAAAPGEAGFSATGSRRARECPFVGEAPAGCSAHRWRPTRQRSSKAEILAKGRSRKTGISTPASNRPRTSSKRRTRRMSSPTSASSPTG